jgi:hypothetical protein
MNKYSITIRISLLILATFGSTACASPTKLPPIPAASETAVDMVNPTTETYTDPFAYCTTVGTIDKPDTRYNGPKVTDELIIGYLNASGMNPSSPYSDNFKNLTIWRCMDKKVYVCNFGANLPCDSQANTDKNPTQAMVDYCMGNLDSQFIPMSITGHATIYSWHCVKDVPKLLDQIEKADAAGYLSGIWYAVGPKNDW